MTQLPSPPFTRASALERVRMAEETWNTRDSKTIAQTCSPDSVWRHQEQIVQGREAIENFLTNKWAMELHFQLKTELSAFTDNRISVRIEYEWQHAECGQWYRSNENAHWEVDADGLITRSDASTNHLPISACARRIGF